MTRTRTVTSLATALFLFSVLLLGVGCADNPTEDDCKKLMQHIVTLEVESAGGKAEALTPEMKADLDAQKKKVSDYVGKDFMGGCMKDLPRSQVTCGLKARKIEDLDNCDES